MNETIVAISTSRSPAGIGIVRLSGEEAINMASCLFESSQSLLDKKNDRRLLYGHLTYQGEILDEVLAVAFYGPNSYTREDMVEVQCHGGPVVLDRILEAFLHQGAKIAEPGEFTRRAFLNGRLDLTQAEAVMDLIEAQSVEAHQQGIGQLSGLLSEKLEDYRQEIVGMLALIVANIDFPTDEVDDANYEVLLRDGRDLLTKLLDLRDSSKRGKIIREGVSTLIIGKPNVGKSSLLNKLLREKRAIVTDVPGTTRDIIEEYINLDGISLRIKDTAGIRDTQDLVEKIGIDMALDSIDEADLILAVFDSSRALDQEDRLVLDKIKDKKTIVLLNKEDLSPVIGEEDFKDYFPPQSIIRTSLLEDMPTKELEEKIREMFLQGQVSSNKEAVLTNMRHRVQLDKAIESLESALRELEMETPLDCVEVDLNDAMNALGSITGMTVEEEVLDTIFSKFCIGK